jgi:tyrosyl-tRNA synthetase
MSVKTDEKIINRILEKGVEQVLPSKDALKDILMSGKRLSIYQGFDPTAPTLHIGHTVGMRKLEDFRKLGHRVIFLIGDFTARIGDPSDKSATRQKLTKEEVEANLKNYVEQASHVIDINNEENPVEILYNSEWLEKLNFGDVIELASEFTVQQMLKRKTFQKRIKEDKPIHINEFMYPIMQGYDSVMMDIDIEVGGNDQLFNMMAGRDMVMNHLGKEKIVLAGKLLETPNGEKMGKTTGNMVRLDEDAKDIYGKIMANPDELLMISFEILTVADLDELEEYQKRLDSGENPIELKKELAFRVTSELKGEEEAKKAQTYFENIYQNKTEDENIEEIEVEDKELPILDLLANIEFAPSKSKARKLVEQGAVKINDEKITDWQYLLTLHTMQPFTLKVGKKVCRIIPKT